MNRTLYESMYENRMLAQKTVCYRATFSFTRKPQLAEAPYPYYDWFKYLD